MVFFFGAIPGLRTLMTSITPRAIFDKSVTEVYGDPSKITEELRLRYFELGHRKGNRGALADFMWHHVHNSPVYADDVKKLSEIKCPTLVTWGDKDRWIPQSHAHLFQKKIKNAQGIMYSGVGHIPMEEIPEISAHDALKFIRSQVGLKSAL